MMQSVTEFLHRIIKTYLMIYLTIYTGPLEVHHTQGYRFSKLTGGHVPNPLVMACFTQVNILHIVVSNQSNVV